MKEHPILFSTEMVKAILEGRKTMTRRVVKAKKESGFIAGGAAQPFHAIETYGGGQWNVPRKTYCLPCPYGKVGDVLWVKEEHYLYGRWEQDGLTKKKQNLKYKFVSLDNDVMYHKKVDALGETFELDVRPNSYHLPAWYKRLGRFMFKKHARIWLEITDIKIERLQDISEEDAVAEGVRAEMVTSSHYRTAIAVFGHLWCSINGEESWNNNPFVWAISFKVLSTTGKPKELNQKYQTA